MSKKRIIIAGAVALVVVVTVVIILAVTLSGGKDAVDDADADTIKCPMTPSNIDADSCVARGCVWNATSSECLVRGFAFGYSISGESTPTNLGSKTTLNATRLLSDAENPWMTPTVEIETWTPWILRVKISNPDDKAFEVHPVLSSFMKRPDAAPVGAARLAASVETTEDGAAFVRVARKDSGEEIFRTAPGALVLSRHFLAVTNEAESRSGAIYGLGEHFHPTLRHRPNSSWGIFARDHGVGPGAKNLYGSHPFYVGLNKTKDGAKAHGVLLLNSNAMDVSINADYSITWQTIGGILDFFIIDGGSSAFSIDRVIDQYYSLVGRPMMPPYWTLGFQLCRYGYKNDSHIRTVFDRVKDLDIPFETQYADIDYMDLRFSFTYDKDNFAGLPELTEYVHDQDRKFMVIVDPAIPYSEANNSYEAKKLGLDKDLFIKDAKSGKPLEGEVWPPGTTVFPDFTDFAKAVDYYSSLNMDFYENQGVKFDGLWIDMNEPANFRDGSVEGCVKNVYNEPKWIPDIVHNKFIYEKTICMDAKQKWGLHYDVHSLYGYSQSVVTYEAYKRMDVFKGKRPFVLSRSTFPGSGHYAAHWLGDNASNWEQLRHSIIAMIEFGLLGIPMNGPDICGFFGQPSEELCTRWSQVGAFYPFSRNHNTIGEPDQDPGAFSEDHARVVKAAMEIRYSLLPYLYTQFYRARVSGSGSVSTSGAVARALFYNYPDEQETWDIQEQFIWGEALLISPALYEKQTKVTAYFPGDQPWYDLETGIAVKLDSNKRAELDSPIDKINVHIAGGSIVAMQGVATTINAARRKPLRLLYAAPTDSSSLFSNGELYWDDGVSEGAETDESGSMSALVGFRALRGRLDVLPTKWGATGILADAPRIEELRVYDVGSTWAVEGVRVDGVEWTRFDYFDDEKRKMLLVTGMNLTLGEEHYVEWCERGRGCGYW